MKPQFLGEVMEESGGLPMCLPVSVDELRAIVILNINRERERCAKIADKYAECGSYHNWAEEIAEEIRKGE